MLLTMPRYQLPRRQIATTSTSLPLVRYYLVRHYLVRHFILFSTSLFSPAVSVTHEVAMGGYELLSVSAIVIRWRMDIPHTAPYSIWTALYCTALYFGVLYYTILKRLYGAELYLRTSTMRSPHPDYASKFIIHHLIFHSLWLLNILYFHFIDLMTD